MQYRTYRPSTILPPPPPSETALVTLPEYPALDTERNELPSARTTLRERPRRAA